MNIILFHKGELPSYLQNTILQIKKYNPYIDIYFISNNRNYELEKMYKFNYLKDLKSEYIEYFEKSNFYTDDPNPLWRTSIERFFYIHELIRKFNLVNIFHFDNDVLIYESFENVLNRITEEKNLITGANENNLVCGMFYTKNLYSFSEIVNVLHSKIKLGQPELEFIYKNRNVVYKNKMVEGFHLNEMTLLKIIQEETNCIKNFPITPIDENFEKFEMCFDPSSWGQNLGGTHQNHPSGYYSLHHFIGRLIDQSILKVVFENKKPYIVYNNKYFKLFNLHIHSKKLENWI
jgi:hypothetical protein